MSDQANGGVAKLPTIHVVWNQDAQTIKVEFEPAEFKTWDMVVASLEMALSEAKHMHGMMRMAAMQQQAMQQMQAQQMANQLGMPSRNPRRFEG